MTVRRRLQCVLHGSRPSGGPRFASRFQPRDWAVITGGVDAPGLGHPVALGEHADHLGPARIVAVGPIRGDVPLVGTKRAARQCVAAGVDHARGTQARQFTERAIVIGKRRRACLAGDPVRVGTHARVENLLAGKARRSRAMAERKAAQDHARDVWWNAIAFRRVGSRATREPMSDSSTGPAPRSACTRCGLRVRFGRWRPRQASPSCRPRPMRSIARGPVPSLPRRHRRPRRRCISPSRPRSGACRPGRRRSG